jgi:hypothetical protein
LLCFDRKPVGVPIAGRPAVSALLLRLDRMVSSVGKVLGVKSPQKSKAAHGGK